MKCLIIFPSVQPTLTCRCSTEKREKGKSSSQAESFLEAKTILGCQSLAVPNLGQSLDSSRKGKVY